MRVTIEDGVYNLLEVKIESVFDNGKGRIIQIPVVIAISLTTADSMNG